jgi:acetylornithine deacetylase/succinyl-diaminopimelate desuccinylase-like protein
MDSVLAYIDNNQERFLTELRAWVKIPSVSAVPEHKADMARSAEHLAAELRRLEADRVETWPTKGHPAVFAEWMKAPGRPTLLVYGHHDVQPVDPVELWASPPFDATIHDGRIWGRGVADDKGQVHIHLKAIEAFVKAAGKLPLNLKLIVEGEEEIGSENLAEVLRDKARDLAADFVCVSDTSMFGPDIPSVCVALRGLMYLQVRVDGPASDLHSGSFGGGVANPVNALARMIARLHDDSGRVLVPGFYDKVRELSAAERQEIAGLPFDEKAWLRSTGAPAAFGEKGYSTLERIWTRPTLDCCGIHGGFGGEGAKTIIPAFAVAKISSRLVADQDPEDIRALVSRFLERVAPPGVRVTVTYLHGGLPYLAPTDHPAYDVARRAFSKAFGRPTVFMREGGSIPIMRTITDAMGKPCLLLGFGQPDENSHAPNEWLDLENYRRGMKCVAYLYEELATLASDRR